MERHEQEDQHDREVKTNAQNTQDREIIAYFSNLNQAQQAANSVSGHSRNFSINEVSAEQMHEKLDSAHAGISIVKIGAPAWLGLASGLIAGAILGMLIYSNRIALPGLAPALSAGPVAVSFLLAGVLGSIGWLIGALVRLFRVSTQKTVPEVRVVVSDDIRPEVEKVFLSAGALDVITASGVEHARNKAGETAQKHEG